MKLLTKKETDRIETSLAQVFLDVLQLEGTMHPDTFDRIIAGIKDAAAPIDSGVFSKILLSRCLGWQPDKRKVAIR